MSYTPTGTIQNVHSISKISRTNFDFSLDYLMEAIRIPLAFLIVGLIFLIVYNIYFCSKSCNCCPSDSSSRSNIDRVDIIDQESRSIRNKFKWNALLTVTLWLTLACALFIYIGNAYIINAVSIMDPAIIQTRDIFTNFNNGTSTISYLGNGIKTSIKSSNCSLINNNYGILSDSISKFDNIGNNIHTKLQDIIQLLSMIHNGINLYLIFYREIIIYTISSLIVLNLIAFVVSIFLLENKICTVLSASIGQIVYFILICLCAGFLLITFILADFCVDPDNHLLNILGGNNSNNRDIIQYYISCQGINPLNNFYLTLINALNGFQILLRQLTTSSISPCANDIALQNTSIITSKLQSEITLIMQSFTCSVIKNQWSTFAYSGVCNKLFYGFSSLWLSQIFTSFFLLILLFSNPTVMKYFLLYNENIIVHKSF